MERTKHKEPHLLTYNRNIRIQITYKFNDKQNKIIDKTNIIVRSDKK